MNLKSLILISGLILVSSFIAYYFLGGLNEVKYSIKPAQSYSIIGKEYSGKNNSMKLESIFDSTKELLDSRFSEGILVIVNDESQNDDDANKVWYFIGIITMSPIGQLPKGYEIREFASKKIIRANIESHNLVMPKPEKVRRKAIGFAKSEGLEVSEFTIEKYLGEGVIEIDFLVKE
jgi:hypothetical protein